MVKWLELSIMVLKIDGRSLEGRGLESMTGHPATGKRYQPSSKWIPISNHAKVMR